MEKAASGVSAAMDVDSALTGLPLHFQRCPPAIICIVCQYALQPSPHRVAAHLRERHSISSTARRSLSQLLRSACLPDPNTLPLPEDNSDPHQLLLVQAGTACRLCTFRSTSEVLVGRHLAKEHGFTGRKSRVLENQTSQRVFLQSWTQNGRRSYWIVRASESPPPAHREAAASDPVESPDHSPMSSVRTRAVDALCRDETRWMTEEAFATMSSGATSAVLDDPSLQNNWMHRTGWETMFRAAKRPLLKRLATLPDRNGSELAIGLVEQIAITSSAADERRLLLIGTALDMFFDRCEDTVRHTDHVLLCWLRSYHPYRPYQFPFQLPIQAATRIGYRRLWKQMTCFAVRIWRLDADVQKLVLGFELSFSWSTAVARLWEDECWSAILFPTTAGPESSAWGCRNEMEALSSVDREEVRVRGSPRAVRPQNNPLQNAFHTRGRSHPCSARQTSSQPRSTLEANQQLDTSSDDDTESDGSEWGQSDTEVQERCDGLLVPNHDLPSHFASTMTGLSDLVASLALDICSEESDTGRINSTLLVYFSGVLGFSLDGDTFARPSKHTSKLSALIYCARLVCLEASIPRLAHSSIGWAARSNSGQLEKLNSVRRRFMCLGCQNPISELQNLRSYGRANSRTDGPTFRVRWSDNGQTVSWAEGQLSIESFRELGHRAIHDAILSSRSLMFGLVPQLDLSKVRDEISNNTAGYSFVQDPQNDLQSAYLNLLRQACMGGANSLMISGSGNWNSLAVRQYLERERQFLRELALLLYLLGGQAPRTTELFKLEYENGSSRARGIYIDEGAVMYVTRHAKARRSTNREFQVARYLPRQAGGLLVLYLVYVRPFASMLRRICLHKQCNGRLLFADPETPTTPWTGAVLSKALGARAHMTVGVAMGVQVYRQVSIAITERHIQQISRPFDRYNDKGEDVGIDVAFAWQSGHRPLRRGTNYGIDGAYPDSLQPALLRVYRWVSTQWHRFLSLTEDHSRLRRNEQSINRDSDSLELHPLPKLAQKRMHDITCTEAPRTKRLRKG